MEERPGNLTAKQLQEILNHVYDRGSKLRDIQAAELIHEMEKTISMTYDLRRKE